MPKKNVFTDQSSLIKYVEMSDGIVGITLQSGDDAWSYDDLCDRETILKSFIKIDEKFVLLLVWSKAN